MDSGEDVRQWHDDRPIPAEYAPPDGDEVRGEDDHDDGCGEGDGEGDAEALEDLRHLLPEV